MSAGMPELGSKISLISKADIRYEGRLFTVDPKECTIALSSVRSFGTEERETPYPISAQNQVYDYILFRGSDIKDIRVVNNVTQPLNDPAIMQLSVPPSMGQPQFQSHAMLGHMGAPQMGQFPSAGYGAMGSLAGLSGGLMPGLGGLQRDPRTGLSVSKANDLIIPNVEQTSILSPAVEPPRPNDHDIIGGASRSTTPASLGSRKSPTNDQGTQAGGVLKHDKRQPRPIQPPGQRNNQQQQHHSQHYQQRRGSQERRNSQDYHQRNQNRQPHQQQQQHQQPMRQHQQHLQPYHQQQNYHQQHHHQQQQQGQGGNQRGGGGGGWIQRGQMRQRGRPRGGSGSSGGGPPGGYNKPANHQGQPNPNNKKNTLKFENDYDFEQANTEFEELRSQLAKVKVEDTSKPEVNGDIDKKDDSGNETGAGENEQEEEHEVFYDKTKSFFDKISCEAVERAKGKSQRTDWRTERKLNSETFGVAATRRGNFRGRGGFRGGFRGGYRGGYRPQQQRRDQQGGNMNPNNRPPSNPQQPLVQQAPQQQSSSQSEQANTSTTTAAATTTNQATAPAAGN